MEALDSLLCMHVGTHAAGYACIDDLLACTHADVDSVARRWITDANRRRFSRSVAGPRTHACVVSRIAGSLPHGCRLIQSLRRHRSSRSARSIQLHAEHTSSRLTRRVTHAHRGAPSIQLLRRFAWLHRFTVALIHACIECSSPSLLPVPRLFKLP